MEILMKDDQYKTLLSKYKPHMLESGNKRAKVQRDTIPTQVRGDVLNQDSRLQILDHDSEPEEDKIELINGIDER